MKPKFQSGVLRRVRNTFHKMAFSYHGGISSSPHPMTTLNVAPQTGRRDAALEQALILLKVKMFSYSEADRSQIYHNILELLEECIRTSKHICNISSGHKLENEESLMRYLILLNDTVQAAATMLFQQQSIIDDESSVNDFIGTDMSSQFQRADEILANSEMNLYHCINEMLEISLPRIMQYREYCTKILPRKDFKRYEKAFAEFQLLYGGRYSLDELKPVSDAPVE